MQKFLLTTALVLPLTAGIGFAQTSTTTTAPTAGQEAAAAASNAADKAGEAASAAADAAGKALDAAGEAAADAVDATGDAAKAAGDRAAQAADNAADAMKPATTTTTPVVGETTTTTTTTPVDGSVSTTETTTTEVTPVAVPDDVVREQAANELRVAWINGSAVTSPDGENVGTIKDVIVDENGMLKAAIVGVGGFLGIGEKQIAIDWSKLTIDYDANKVATAITREEAQAAPAFVFRDRESAPAPVATTTGTTGTAPVGTTAPAN